MKNRDESSSPTTTSNRIITTDNNYSCNEDDDENYDDHDDDENDGDVDDEFVALTRIIKEENSLSSTKSTSTLNKEEAVTMTMTMSTNRKLRILGFIILPTFFFIIGRGIFSATTTGTAAVVVDTNNDNDNNNGPSFVTVESLKHNSKSKNNKSKFFVMHIGPHKTGTTSFQKDSGLNWNYTKSLFQDNVIYIGRNWKTNQIRNQEFTRIKVCMMNIYNEKIQTKKNGQQQQNDEKNKDIITSLLLDCWQNNNINTSSRMTPEYSLIDSDEMYMSTDWSSSVGIQHLEALRSIFVDYLYYEEFLVVGAYRRYIQWLPSTYRQITGNSPGCLSTLSRNGGLLLYPKNNDDIQQEKEQQELPPNLMNRRCRNIWNDYSWDLIQRKEKDEVGNNNEGEDHEFYGYERTMNHNGDIETMHNIDGMIPYIQPLIGKPGFNNNGDGGGMKILNYFQQLESESNQDENYNSITTEFYCTILGMARTPNTCTYSKNRSNQDIEIFNKRSIISVIYDDILMEAVQRNFIIDTGNSDSSSSSSDDGEGDGDEQDHTATTAAKTKTTSLSRSQLRRNLAEYHHKILVLLESSNNNNDDDYTATTTTTTTGTNITRPPTTTTATAIIISSAMIMNSLPLICPPKNELQVFLKKSLQFEELIYSNFDFDSDNLNLNSSNNKSSTSIKKTNNRKRIIRIEEHKKQFDKMVYDEKSFCWIDTERLFYNVTSYKQLLEERLIINNW